MWKPRWVGFRPGCTEFRPGMLTLDSLQSVETRPSGLIRVGDSAPWHLIEVLFERLLRPTERCGENVFLLCVFLLDPSRHY